MSKAPWTPARAANEAPTTDDLPTIADAARRFLAAPDVANAANLLGLIPDWMYHAKHGDCYGDLPRPLANVMRKLCRRTANELKTGDCDELVRTLIELAEPAPAKPPPLALSDTEYTVLQQLAKDHPQRVKIADLAAALGCRRPSVSQAVQRLEQLSLVARPGERSGVAITDEGLAALRPGERPAHLLPPSVR